MWWRLPKPYGDMSSGHSELHSSHSDANIIPIYASLAPKKNHQERLAKLPGLAIRCSLQSATIGRCGIPSTWLHYGVKWRCFSIPGRKESVTWTASMWPQELPFLRLCGVKPLGFSKMWRKPNSRCPRPSVSSNWRWNSSDHIWCQWYQFIKSFMICGFWKESTCSYLVL